MIFTTSDSFKPILHKPFNKLPYSPCFAMAIERISLQCSRIYSYRRTERKTTQKT